jgi:hypothetical protein
MGDNYFIFAADVYCEECTRAIKRRLRSEGNVPANPRDGSSYDSDEWPKGSFSDEESDSPQHCGSGETCLDPMVLSDGCKVGHFFGNPLTGEGERNVREMHRDSPSEITRFWMDHYGLSEDAESGEDARTEAARAETLKILATLDTFTKSYVETALWLSHEENDEGNGGPLDANYGPEDIAPATLLKMVEHCQSFQHEHAALIESCGDVFDDAWDMAGYHFWMTRNGHGTGFWNGDWPEAIGEQLTAASEVFGEYDLSVGDDGMIHGYPG